MLPRLEDFAIEDIARNIRLSKPIGNPSADILSKSNGDTVNRLCLDNTHYAWNTVEYQADGSIDDGTQEKLREADGSGGTLIVAGPPYFTLIKSELNRGSCSSPFELVGEPEAVKQGDETFFSQGITSLIEEGINIRELAIEPLLSSGGKVQALRIDLTLFAGESDLIDTSLPDLVCNGFVQAGDQFCDVVRFSTTVNFRLP